MDDGLLSAAIHPNEYSPDYVFQHYCARRAGIVKALTEDVEEFYDQCDPDKNELALHGLPDETWETRLQAEEVPPEVPEPEIGINFTRDGMSKKDWIAFVAVHSDAWLISVAFYFAGRLAFNRESRAQLFKKINGVPTVLEAVTAYKEKLPIIPNGSSKNKPDSKPPNPNRNPVMAPPPLPMLVEENGAGDDDGGACGEDRDLTVCGACMETYSCNSEFWIRCDLCQKWFHGKCVQVTADMANEIKQYMCPGCRYRTRRAENQR